MNNNNNNSTNNGSKNGKYNDDEDYDVTDEASHTLQCKNGVVDNVSAATEVFKVHNLGSNGVKEKLIKAQQFHQNQILFNVPDKTGPAFDAMVTQAYNAFAKATT
uniref:Uncharacterized protein n=1 Tax=Lygus hesperus TaxID=30085 RepID=A0A0A9Y7N3_LYGHE